MFNDYTLSMHLRNDRADRVAKIATTIGFGEIIKETVHKGADILLSDTGVIFVVNKVAKIIITIYPGSVKEITAIYHGKIPQPLFKQILKNEKVNWG